MSKAPLKDIQENIAHMRPCPNCTRTPGLSDNMHNQMGPSPNGRHPRGRYKGYNRSAMPVCKFCQGLRVVFPNRICQCGFPAVRWDEKALLWSCGDGACIKAAVWRREHPLPPVGGYPVDWYGCHGGMFDG
jgi:hypothetical protein